MNMKKSSDSVSCTFLVTGRFVFIGGH